MFLLFLFPPAATPTITTTTKRKYVMFWVDLFDIECLWYLLYTFEIQSCSFSFSRFSPIQWSHFDFLLCVSRTLCMYRCMCDWLCAISHQLRLILHLTFFSDCSVGVFDSFVQVFYKNVEFRLNWVLSYMGWIVYTI